MPKQKNSNQSDKFIQTAKELECNESEKAFNEKLGKLTKVKPEKEKSEND